MIEESRYHRAVRAVWERSYLEYRRWPVVRREAVQPALDALLAWLSDAANETDLVNRYVEIGDAPGNILRPHLPTGFDEDDLLVLEEAAFCLRMLVLHGER